MRLRKTAPPAWQPPPARLDAAPWRETRFGPVRIKLRASGADADPTPLVAGDVLATVSRRHPIRDRIGMWTSGNRVFGLVDPGPVGDLIDQCNEDLETRRFTHARTLEGAGRLKVPAETATRMFDLLLVELQEHLTEQITTGGPSL